MPWRTGRRRRHGGPARFQDSRKFSYRSSPPGAAGICVSGHFQWLWRHARLLQSDSACRGPMGNRGLHPSPATEPRRNCFGCTPRREVKTGIAMSSVPMNGPGTNGGFSVTAELAHELRRWQMPSLIGGTLLLIASIIGAFFRPDEFFRSYLFGYLFWIGLALGSMAI